MLVAVGSVVADMPSAYLILTRRSVLSNVPPIFCGRLTIDEKGQADDEQFAGDRAPWYPCVRLWERGFARCGTQRACHLCFPSCIGMAASFDDDMIDRVFTAVSDEARAKNTEARRRGQIGKYSV